jgi:hypothetical protein
VPSAFTFRAFCFFPFCFRPFVRSPFVPFVRSPFALDVPLGSQRKSGVMEKSAFFTERMQKSLPVGADFLGVLIYVFVY